MIVKCSSNRQFHNELGINSQFGAWEVAHGVGVREIKGEEFLRIRIKGQNGLHNTKLKILLSVLQILEVSQELLGGGGRSNLQIYIIGCRKDMNTANTVLVQCNC